MGHGARSRANLSTALAGTNLSPSLSLSPWHRCTVRPGLSVALPLSAGRYENTPGKIYCPNPRLCSFVGVGPGRWDETIQKFDWTFYCEARARFFAPPRLDSRHPRRSVLNPLLPPASPIPPAETLRADFAKGGFAGKTAPTKVT